MKRKIPPMPREMIFCHPKALAMNSAAFGMLTRILDHFWFTDCSPLPTTDHGLFVISRAHKPTWFQNRDEIKAVLQDVTPELAKALENWRKRHEALSDLRSRGHQARRDRKLEKAIANRPAIGPAYEPRIAERNRSTAIAAPGAAAPKSGFRETAG